MANQLGTATILRIGAITIARGTSVQLSRASNMVDVTNKDSAGNQEVLPGMRSGTMQFEGIFDETQTTGAGFSLLWGYQINGTAVTVKFGTTVVGDKIYTGSCYISNLQMSAPNLDKQTFSCTLTMTGSISESAN